MSETFKSKARRMLALVEAYKGGNQSLLSFCKDRRIPESTFCYWLKKFKGIHPSDKVSTAPSATPRFVRLDTEALIPSATGQGRYELSFPDGRVLRMPPSLPVESVLSLLKGSVG